MRPFPIVNRHGVVPFKHAHIKLNALQGTQTYRPTPHTCTLRAIKIFSVERGALFVPRYNGSRTITAVGLVPASMRRVAHAPFALSAVNERYAAAADNEPSVKVSAVNGRSIGVTDA